MPYDFLDDHHVNYRIRSLHFVRNLLVRNALNYNKSYYLDGKYLESENAVVFSLISAHPIDQAAKDNSEG